MRSMIILLTLTIHTLLSHPALAQSRYVAPAPQCPAQPLALDGGYYTISYKYVEAQVPLTKFASALNQLSIIGTKGIVFNLEGAPRCTVIAHVHTVGESKNDVLQIKLRVDANCDNYSLPGMMNAELKLIKSLIEEIEQKIPDLSLNPKWKDIPPCTGGGFSGSN